MLTYCVAFLVYDWLLCIGNEVRFIWRSCSRRVTPSSLVYAFTRYMFIIQTLLAIVTIYPISDLVRHLLLTTVLSDRLIIAYIEVRSNSPPEYIDLFNLHPLPYHSCTANVWTQGATNILGAISLSSAFRLLLATFVR